MVEVHIKENLPMVKDGKYTKSKAVCEFCSNKHSFKEEYCGLKLDGVEANQNIETALSATIGKIMQNMVHKRRLILAIVLKNKNNCFDLNELRLNTKHFSSEGEELTNEQRIKMAPNLKSCFTGFSHEETLGGDDQWYCNVCNEHRDITKQL